MFRLQDKKKKEKVSVVKEKRIRPISEIIKINMNDINQIANAYNEIVKNYGEDKVPPEFILKVLGSLGKKEGKKRSKSKKK